MRSQFHPDALDTAEAWPDLPYEAWKPTLETLHLWTQIVGKIRMVLSPPQNHWWHVPLYVSARGLTTSLVPAGDGAIELEFDLVRHLLELRASDGGLKHLPLVPRTVAGFYREVTAALAALGVEVRIRSVPDEVPDPIPFEEDVQHGSYDPDAVGRFFRALLTADVLLKAFRGHFTGKASPVQFFWGTFDLSLALFSGRRAPPRPGAGAIERESSSHEYASFGFWPGSPRYPAPAFFSYALPEPPGLRQARLRPDAARFDERMGELILPYDAVRAARSPTHELLAFFDSAYEAAVELGRWDRDALAWRDHSVPPPAFAPPSPP